MLKEELMLLQEPGSYVGEVVKVMGKSKVLVKVCMFIITILYAPISSIFHSLVLLIDLIC